MQKSSEFKNKLKQTKKKTNQLLKTLKRIKTQKNQIKIIILENFYDKNKFNLKKN